MEQAPKPFLTPPVKDSVIYLIGEAAELLIEIHAGTRPNDLRNPNSTRKGVATEAGDVLLMLGTCAGVDNYMEIRRYWKEAYTDPIRLATSMLDDCVSLSYQIDDNGSVQSPVSFQFVIDTIYSRVVNLCMLLEISPAYALQLAMNKSEERAGLL